jgi:aldose 1-epimerase
VAFRGRTESVEGSSRSTTPRHAQGTPAARAQSSGGVPLRTAVAVRGTLKPPGDTGTIVTRQGFGETPGGVAVDLYTLTGRVHPNPPDPQTSGAHHLEAQIITYGGALVSLRVPDRDGVVADVVLGFDDLAGYVAHGSYFGAIVGRYANRIAGGRFHLDGEEHRLALNDGPNALHGGIRGFDKVVWSAREIDGGVELRHLSNDGEEGFPGNLTTTVRYTLDDGALVIEYSAVSDRDTPINLTNHAYFNLAGHGNGDVLEHLLTLDASLFTPVAAGLIPTGELFPVAGTPFDFREETAIGARIDAPDRQLELGRGYDHNFVIDREGPGLARAACVREPRSGRVMEVFTTEPGVQLYTGNFLDGSAGKGGKAYRSRSAFCLETQHFPDSPNQPAFPSTILEAGQTYHSITAYRFSSGE